MSDTTILFREEQRFRPRWLWAVLGVLGVGIGIAVIHITPGRSGVIVGLAGMLTMAATMLLMHTACLVATVTRQGLSIRFRPFHRREHAVARTGVTSVRAVSYSPIRDYGGWGIRIGWRKKAYNVSGRRGVELRYQDGRVLLIGSQRAEELEAALRKAWPDVP